MESFPKSQDGFSEIDRLLALTAFCLVHFLNVEYFAPKS